MSRARRIAARLAAGTLAVLGTSVAIGATAGPAHAGSKVANACQWSVDSFYRGLTVTLEGTPSPTRASKGTAITLADVRAVATFPADVVSLGISTGFLHEGRNELKVQIHTALSATNTEEKAQALDVIDTVVTTNVTVQGARAQAGPITVDVALPTTTWTATGGPVKFAQAGRNTLDPQPGLGLSGAAFVPKGSVLIHTMVEDIPVNIDCAPGTPNPKAKGAKPQFGTAIPAKRWPAFATVPAA